MNGYERTVKFVRGEPVDRPPFMPLAIEWIAREQGIPYPEFVYEPEKRIRAYSGAVKKYDIDCVLPDADFYEQLEDFGSKPVFDGKAFSAAPIIEDVTEISHLSLPEYAPGSKKTDDGFLIRPPDHSTARVTVTSPFPRRSASSSALLSVMRPRRV